MPLVAACITDVLSFMIPNDIVVPDTYLLAGFL
jgi:Flp pilus assembly protein protease CpaA